jgi:hypothetical protein
MVVAHTDKKVVEEQYLAQIIVVRGINSEICCHCVVKCDVYINTLWWLLQELKSGNGGGATGQECA